MVESTTASQVFDGHMVDDWTGNRSGTPGFPLAARGAQSGAVQFNRVASSSMIFEWFGAGQRVGEWGSRVGGAHDVA